jgi:hypothetical protein
MKEFYQRKVNIAETLLKLAKHGFAESMPEYGDRLKKADYEETVKILSEIEVFVQGIKEMEDNRAFAQKQLQEEIEKEKKGNLS